MISVDVVRKSQLNAPAKFATLQRRFLAKAGQIVEGEAKSRAPVDTGRLRASITNKVDGEKAIIGSNVEYAPYVEYGTRRSRFKRSRAQPFMRTALDNNKANLKRLFATMFRQVFSGK